MGDEITDYLASTSALSATAVDGPLKLKPGASLGGYRVLALLGRGACGEVWKVHDDSLNCNLALKLFSPKEQKNEKEIARLRRQFVEEARCLAKFRHPRIVRVHALSANGDMPFFTMDFLHPLVRPIPRRKVRKIVGGVLSALEELHSKGFVHRDIKPSNVLLDDRGNAVLADFGVVQIGDGETAAKVRPDDGPTVTLSDAPARITGTPAFGAPEQFAGKPATPASDLHAVGRLALWLFDGPPPLSWRWFVLRATNSSPAMRYADARSMKRALTATLNLERAAIAFAVAIAAGAGALLAYALSPRCETRTLDESCIKSERLEFRYPYLARPVIREACVITLEGGRDYTLAHGQYLKGRKSYLERIDGARGTTNLIEQGMPIVIQGSGTLHAPEILWAQVRLKPGVTLVTSGEFSGIEPLPRRPPADANLTNLTIYSSYIVEKGAKLVFTDNKEYPPSLVERR